MIAATPDATRRALTPRGAPFEYWYLKLHVGDVAFLVDFIIRRRSRQAEIRLSYWIRGAATVTHDVHEHWSVEGTTIRIGGAEFGDGWTRGSSADARWDLRVVAGPNWLEPGRLGGKLRAFDSQIALSPGARVDGTIEVAGETFHCSGEPGVLTHYWSVHLPDRWVWLSANLEEVDVEALFSRQRLWRIPFLRLPVGYAYVADRGSSRYVISPLTGFARATGTSADVRVRAWSPRAGSFEIAASRGSATVNELGEGISQTLVADGRVAGHDVTGRMGLETRGWS